MLGEYKVHEEGVMRRLPDPGQPDAGDIEEDRLNRIEQSFNAYRSALAIYKYEMNRKLDSKSKKDLRGSGAAGAS